MHRMICDNETCKKEELPENNMAPKGWLTVYLRGDYTARGTRDYCSAACLVTDFTPVPALSDRERTIEAALLATQIA